MGAPKGWWVWFEDALRWGYRCPGGGWGGSAFPYVPQHCGTPMWGCIGVGWGAHSVLGPIGFSSHVATGSPKRVEDGGGMGAVKPPRGCRWEVGRLQQGQAQGGHLGGEAGPRGAPVGLGGCRENSGQDWGGGGQCRKQLWGGWGGAAPGSPRCAREIGRQEAAVGNPGAGNGC